MLGRIIFGLIGIPLGTMIILYTHKIVDNFTGPLDFAERWFSSVGSGTYTFFRISGFIIILASLLVMLGVANWFYDAIITPLNSFNRV